MKKPEPVKSFNGISVALLRGAFGPGYMKDWTEEQIKNLISVGGDELLDILDELVNGITRCKIH